MSSPKPKTLKPQRTSHHCWRGSPEPGKKKGRHILALLICPPSNPSPVPSVGSVQQSHLTRQLDTACRNQVPVTSADQGQEQRQELIWVPAGKPMIDSLPSGHWKGPSFFHCEDSCTFCGLCLYNILLPALLIWLPLSHASHSSSNITSSERSPLIST